jgi:tetratricopeptide (TPR) repeat protein
MVGGEAAPSPPPAAHGTIDMSLPKELELQGLEVQRLGMRVRQLASAQKYAEALQVAEQRLALSEQTYGLEHPMSATCLNDVGTFVQAYGQFDRAEQLFEGASRIHKKHLGDAHPHNIAALNNLALLYQAKGDATKEQAMRMLVKMLQSRNEAVPGA